jgi:mono/diheme cytochrome c family protein
MPASEDAAGHDRAEEDAMSRGVKVLLWVVVAGVVVFALIQLVPYGRDHSNPPVTSTVAWDSPETEQLVRDACYDCHSNETVWPWYSNIAPASWLLQRDVDEGRQTLNFSEWPQLDQQAAQAIASAVAEVVNEGEMPPSQYTLMHSAAKLSDQQKQQLVEGAKRSLVAQ